MTFRKFFILDKRSKSLVVDNDGEPMRFGSLHEAQAKAVDLRGSGSPEFFAVQDDLGNKWIWTKTGALRVGLSNDTKDRIERAINVDRTKLGFTLQTRCRADGMVETCHHIRLPDGPPIPIQPHSDWTTTERYADKASWFERGTLESFVGSLPTRTHKLERRALNEKSRAVRAAAKARQAEEDYEAGVRMTCQVCGRLIRSKQGTIAHHGYTRPGDGWQTSSCGGTHHAPFEVSNAHLIDTIVAFERHRESEKLRIEKVRDEREPVVVRVKPHWSENRRHPHVFTFDRHTYDQVRASSEGQLTSRATFDDRKDEFISFLQASLRQTETILNELRQRNENWRQSHEFVDGEFRPIRGVERAA